MSTIWSDLPGTLIDIVVYGGVGIIVMLVGYALIDRVIPCDFPKEIKEGNRAIGWVSAGIYIGLGLIIRAAVTSWAVQIEPLKLWQGIVDTLFFAAAGIVFFLLSYYLVDLVNRRYKFSEELKTGNEAAGIMVFGIFVGMALIISGVIH